MRCITEFHPLTHHREQDEARNADKSHLGFVQSPPNVRGSLHLEHLFMAFVFFGVRIDKFHVEPFALHQELIDVD